MSSIDLFNQAHAKREEAQRCRQHAAELSGAGANLGGSLGPVASGFGPQTWLGPNATRVGRLLDECFSALQTATGSINGDAHSMFQKARWLEEQAEVLESNARAAARAEAEAEAARHRAIAEAAAVQARAAQAAADAAQAAAQAAAQSAVPGSPNAAPSPASPAVVIGPVTIVPHAETPPAANADPVDDYSGWY
jgi:hypothetical protein